jgi:hypothetical protein
MQIRNPTAVVAVWLALATSAALGQSPSDGDRGHFAPEKDAWWKGLLDPKPNLEAKAGPKVPGAVEAGPNRSPVNRAHELDRLMKAYLRRLEVCDRLRDVAQQGNNADLLAEAEQLEAMAWSVYQQQARRLGSVPGLEGPESRSASKTLPANSPGGAQSQRPAARPERSAELREGNP